MSSFVTVAMVPVISSLPVHLEGEYYLIMFINDAMLSGKLLQFWSNNSHVLSGAGVHFGVVFCCTLSTENSNPVIIISV